MGLLVKIADKRLEDVQVFLDKAVEFIISGKIVSLPTNSVYSLSCDPMNLNAIEKLFAIKYREREKGLLLLISDFEEASRIAHFNNTAKNLAKQYWPGQLTLILQKKEPNIIPLEVTSFQETIGLRVPENQIILEILNILKERGHFGGIIGTSANYSGEPPSISGDEVAKKFLGLGAVDFIIDGGKSKSKIATTIVDCTTDTVKFLRIGKITEEEIRNYLSTKESEGGSSE